jgi:hypothetical protein
MSPEDAVLYSKIAGGSIGKALGFNKDLMVWRRDLLTGLGSIRKNSASDISSLSELVSSGASQNETERLELGFRFILLWIRDIVLTRLGSGDLTNTDFTETINSAARKWELDDLLEMEGNVERAWYDIVRANANTKLVLDNLFLRLSVYAGVD